MNCLDSDDGGAMFDTTSVSFVCRDALYIGSTSVGHCHPPLVATELLVEKGDYFLMSHDKDTSEI